MSTPRTLASRLAIVALSLIVAWRIIQVNAVLYDDTGRPRLPVPAVGALSGDKADSASVAAVLHENPAQAAVLLVMARDAEAQVRHDDARRAYEAAYQLAPLDREVLAASAGFFLRRGDIAHGLALLDRLVEAYPDTSDAAFAAMAEVLAIPQYAAAWNAVIARRPAWLGPFIVSSCARGTDPALLVPLFLGRIAAGQATAAEGGCLVERLRAAGRWDEAYQVWLNTLARDRLADVGYVYNGGFEYAPTGVGFDWTLSRRAEREAGYSVDIVQATGAVGKRALRVGYNGKRQSGSPIAQYLALPPGRYVLSGAARPSAIGGGRGIQWTLRCASGAAQPPLAASERFVGSSEWRRFVLDVTVPSSCRGQLLQLEPVGADDGPAFVSGTAWFDDLALRHVR